MSNEQSEAMGEAIELRVGDGVKNGSPSCVYVGTAKACLFGLMSSKLPMDLKTATLWARRLVACWNLLRGYSLAELEQAAKEGCAVLSPFKIGDPARYRSVDDRYERIAYRVTQVEPYVRLHNHEIAVPLSALLSKEEIAAEPPRCECSFCVIRRVNGIETREGHPHAYDAQEPTK